MRHGEDPYSRLNYRRLIAWPERIAREWPLLERELSKGPERSVVDLGCGTGEHALHFAANGFRALGVDRSDEQIELAREYENRHAPHGPRFVEGDFLELDRLTDERFGGAICLGNVVPHLEDDVLALCLRAWGKVLLPGGRLLLQVVNYERILGQGIRHLPINFREAPEGAEGEIVFVRFVTPDGDHHVRFYPTTLALKAGAEPPLELVKSKEVRLRAWRRADLSAALDAGGFEVAATFGDMVGGDYDAEQSADLVVVAVSSGT